MRRLPLFVLVIHTLLVTVIATLVGVLGGEAVMLWNLFMVVDMPLSIIFGGLLSPIEVWSQSTFGVGLTYTVTYALFFALVGGIQYYVIGTLIRYLICQRINH
jgi:hypothetical protein